MAEVFEIQDYGFYVDGKERFTRGTIDAVWAELMLFRDKFLELDCSVNNELIVYLKPGCEIKELGIELSPTPVEGEIE